MLKTRITEMLGIQYPIIQGGMLWIARAELAAAVSNAGGLGIITSANFANGKELREEIRKTKTLTDKPFGVNISLFPSIRPLPNDEFIAAVIDESVKVIETSGVRAPKNMCPSLKKLELKLFTK